jgi:hypothetical protein
MVHEEGFLKLPVYVYVVSRVDDGNDIFYNLWIIIAPLYVNMSVLELY